MSGGCGPLRKVSVYLGALSSDQLHVALLGEFHDLDRQPLVLGIERRDVGKENLGIDVAA